MEIQPVIDATFRHRPTTTFLGERNDSAWEPHRYLLDEDGMLESSMGGILVRRDDRERITLVDLDLDLDLDLGLGLGRSDMMGRAIAKKSVDRIPSRDNSKKRLSVSSQPHVRCRDHEGFVPDVRNEPNRCTDPS